jgi:hypothetical protein
LTSGDTFKRRQTAIVSTTVSSALILRVDNALSMQGLYAARNKRNTHPAGDQADDGVHLPHGEKLRAETMSHAGRDRSTLTLDFATF